MIRPLGKASENINVRIDVIVSLLICLYVVLSYLSDYVGRTAKQHLLTHVSVMKLSTPVLSFCYLMFS